MVQYRVIDNRRSEAEVVRDMMENVSGFKQYLFSQIAREIAFNSPVDTGVYADGHSVSATPRNVKATETSHGKPPVEPDAKRSETFERLLAEVLSLPKDADNAYFANNAIHARHVEYGHPSWNRGPYAVYRKARAKIGTFAQKAADAIKAGRA